MKWHYNNTLGADTHDLAWSAYNPCAATPLYDAIGKTVSNLNAQVTDEDNVLVTIITDGYENCSREWTLPMVRNLIEKLKKQKWTFTLIGTDNLDVEEMASSMCIDEHLEFTQDEVGTSKMFTRELHAREKYYACIDSCEKMPIGRYFDNDDEEG